MIATAYPSTAGTITGAGEYHIGERCTLTVTPAEDVDFYCWQKNGNIVSNATSYSFNVDEDTVYIEAHFSHYPVGKVTASYSPEADNPNSNSVELTWSRADTEWELLKQFPVKDELGGMATDGEHLYVTYPYWVNPAYEFEKYTMEGELVESFNLEGLNNALCLVYDGNNFYCNNIRSKDLYDLYHIDLENKKILEEFRDQLDSKYYDYNTIFFTGNDKLPRWSGYSLGYYLVKKYLEKTNKKIEDAFADKYAEFKIAL